jgi:hypothetical protein
MKIIRVFPRKTSATPDDENVRVNCIPGMFDEADEIHISVAFEWDLPRAEELRNDWKHVAPVKMGGPATGDPSGDFVAGRYVKRGYTITSRGCPNRCWFCSVPKREGGIRELPIVPGNNVLDDNLLACSETHIMKVFDMLRAQHGPKEFTGGLEAARLKEWHVRELETIRPKQMFFAYDTPDDLEHLRRASSLLWHSSLAKSSFRCYVLVGEPSDSPLEATERLNICVELGFVPMAMLWRNAKNETTPEWRKFQKIWARPAIINARTKSRGPSLATAGEHYTTGPSRALTATPTKGIVECG